MDREDLNKTELSPTPQGSGKTGLAFEIFDEQTPAEEVKPAVEAKPAEEDEPAAEAKPDSVATKGAASKTVSKDIPEEFSIPENAFDPDTSSSFAYMEDGYSIRTTYMPRFTEVSENYRMAGEKKQAVSVEKQPTEVKVGAVKAEPSVKVAPTSEEVDSVEVDHVVVTRAPIVENEPKDESMRYFKFDGDDVNLPEREKRESPAESEELPPAEEPTEQVEEQIEPAEEPKPLKDPSEYDIPDPKYRVREIDVDGDGAKKNSGPSCALPEGVRTVRGEYENTSQRDKLKDRFLDTVMSAKVRLVAASLFLLLSLVLEVLNAVGVDLAALVGITAVSGRAVVALCISAAATVVVIPELIRAVSYLLRKRVHPELILFPGLLLMIGYTLAIALSAETDYPTFSSIYSLGAVMAVWGTLRCTNADFRGFKIISSVTGFKTVIDKSFTRDLPRENMALDGAVDEYTSTTARTFKTGSVSDYMTRCSISAESSSVNLLMLVLGLSLALVMGVVCYFIGEGSLTVALMGALGIVLASVPVVSILSHKLTYDLASLECEREGGCFVGESSLESISEVDVITYRDTEIFGKEDVSLKKVHLFGQGENMDKALRQMCSLFTVVGGPLEAYFTASVGRKGASASDVTVEKDGIYGVTEGRRVAAGTEGFMRRHGIIIPDDGSRFGSAGADSTRIMYGAEDGRVYVKFFIRYSFSEEFTMLMPYFKSKHVVPLIYTRDPNLSDEFIKTLTLGEDLIRIMKITEAEQGEDTVYRRLSAEAVTLGDRQSAIDMILLSKKHAALRHAFSVLELCAMGLGLALGTVLSVLGCFSFGIGFYTVMTLVPFGIQALLILAEYISARRAFRSKREEENQ